MAGRSGHRGFGHIRRLPSRRYQASYTGPDGRRHNAATTFEDKMAAERWLAREHDLIAAETWVSPVARRSARTMTLERLRRAVDGPPRPQAEDTRALPLPARPADPSRPRRQAAQGHHERGRPRLVRRPRRVQADPRAHAYGLLRTILATAVVDEKIVANPCRIRSAGVTKRARNIEPATLDRARDHRCRPPPEVPADVAALGVVRPPVRRGDRTAAPRPRPQERASSTYAAASSAPTARSSLATRRARPARVTWPSPRTLCRCCGSTSTRCRCAGVTPSCSPPPTGSPTSRPRTLYRVFYPAREAAGRPDLRWHDLRHTGAVLAAQTGATLAELMGRLGHSTPQAALRYQHAAQGRDAEIARRLSAMVEGRP